MPARLAMLLLTLALMLAPVGRCITAPMACDGGPAAHHAADKAQPAHSGHCPACALIAPEPLAAPAMPAPPRLAPVAPAPPPFRLTHTPALEPPPPRA